MSEVVDVSVPRQSRHVGAYVEMLISSVLGLVAAFVLSIDAIALAKDPNAVLACDINPLISCGKVGITWQANLFGWPNSFLGLVTEPIVITLAVAALGGVKFPRWFMFTAQAIYTCGFLFAVWLFLEAYFVIGALCPWCLLITATTTLVFASMTRVNLLDNNFGLRPAAHARVTRWCNMWFDTYIAVLFLTVIIVMIIVKYL